MFLIWQPDFLAKNMRKKSLFKKRPMSQEMGNINQEKLCPEEGVISLLKFQWVMILKTVIWSFLIEKLFLWFGKNFLRRNNVSCILANLLKFACAWFWNQRISRWRKHTLSKYWSWDFKNFKHTESQSNFPDVFK